VPGPASRWSRLPARVGALASALLLSVVAFLTPQAYSTITQAAEDPSAAITGYSLADPAIAAFFRQHGGAAGLGNPISNPMRLLGSRVQLFQRQAIEVRPDGSVGTLNLVDGDFLPLAAVAGPGLAPDAGLLARLPKPGSPGFAQQASAYLDSAAPNEWNGMRARFGTTYRAMLKCSDLAGVASCTGSTTFSAVNDLYGLPTGKPVADPHSTDYAYLRFQRGVMVYSRTASDTQWLLLGELFKQVLLGNPLPPEVLNQISASPAYARFYAQYDPLARDSLARPNELPGTSLAGAFQSTLPSNRANTAATAADAADPQLTAANVPPPNAPAPNAQAPNVPAPNVPAPRLPAPAKAPARSGQPPLDARFGVTEGFEDPILMSELKAGWERVVLPWDQVQPNGPGDFSHLGMTVSADKMRAEVARGVHLAGVLQFTPDWAQANPAAGQRSVPKNLDLAFDDPQNYWGRFVYETVRAYAGQIDDWIIWNEPDFRAGDPSGGAYTWAGTDEEFARLLAVGYLAAKKANPAASVSFPATSYWVEELSVPRRAPFYERILRLLATDPRAADHNFYHDAVSLNLYRSPDDVYRVHSIFVGIQHRYGIDRPVWLTETNAMPTDDMQINCADRQGASPIKTTLDQQAAFAVQSFALAAAAGYQHTEFYSMVDGDTCQEPAWGLERTDGSRRPVADALRTAVNYFSSYTNARFAPLTRPQEAWPAWPGNPGSYVPNWQVYQVAFDRPGNQRVTALWNGDGGRLRVRVPKNGTTARVVDRRGFERPARAVDGAWLVDLPGATAGFQPDDANKDPDGYHAIGGEPMLLVEDGVDPSTPVVAPALAG
jgi:hypothetical protein